MHPWVNWHLLILTFQNFVIKTNVTLSIAEDSDFQESSLESLKSPKLDWEKSDLGY